MLRQPTQGTRPVELVFQRQIRHGQKFTGKQEAMIAALLTKSTHLAAAKKAGIHPATFYRWMHVPEFREAYREARRELVETLPGKNPLRNNARESAFWKWLQLRDLLSSSPFRLY